MAEIGQSIVGRLCVTAALAAAFAATTNSAGVAAKIELHDADEKYCKTFERYEPERRGDSDPGQLQIVCRPGYAIQYNAKTRDPDWVIEILEAKDLEGPEERRAKRKDNFKEDPAIDEKKDSDEKDIKGSRRALLCHYRTSGYARGHQAPAADYKFDQTEMNDSFFLSNMSPQVGASFNSGIWARLEERVRELVVTRKKLVVFTGPIYDARDMEGEDWVRPEKPFIWGDCLPDKEKNKPGEIKDKVGTGLAVPDGFYKIIYDPRRRRVLAFAFPNRRLPRREIGEFRATVRQIEELTGLNFFPGFTQRTQNILEKNEGEMWRW